MVIHMLNSFIVVFMLTYKWPFFSELLYDHSYAEHCSAEVLFGRVSAEPL